MGLFDLTWGTGGSNYIIFIFITQPKKSFEEFSISNAQIVTCRRKQKYGKKFHR